VNTSMYALRQPSMADETPENCNPSSVGCDEWVSELNECKGSG
jgi:hypothetical protein